MHRCERKNLMSEPESSSYTLFLSVPHEGAECPNRSLVDPPSTSREQIASEAWTASCVQYQYFSSWGGVDKGIFTRD